MRDEFERFRGWAAKRHPGQLLLLSAPLGWLALRGYSAWVDYERSCGPWASPYWCQYAADTATYMVPLGGVAASVVFVAWWAWFDARNNRKD